MTLQEILSELVNEDKALILKSNHGIFTPENLLTSLSDPQLKTAAHYQPGLYIAKVDDGGYLGEVLFRVEQ